MKQINLNTFLPEKGEIMKHEDVFGVEPGQAFSGWRHFGDPRNHRLNPTSICIEVGPIDHTETKLLFSANSAMTNMLGGNRVMIMSTKPNAEPGDPENVFEMEYGYGKLNQGLLFFVNDKDEHPSGVIMTSKWGYRDGRRAIVQVPEDQGKQLKPFIPHYLTYSRVDAPEGSPANAPLSVFHVATNDEEAGGEVKLDVTGLTGDLDAIEVHLGPLGPGLFIPDNNG